MQLGVFSISLAVKNLEASKSFYERNTRWTTPASLSPDWEPMRELGRFVLAVTFGSVSGLARNLLLGRWT